MAGHQRFHRKCGINISLSNDGRTATRDGVYGLQDWNGLVFSQQPLRDGEIFEVRIDKMVRITKSYDSGLCMRLP